MKKNEWFADWFDTKYYHILYKNRDASEAQLFIKNLTSELRLKQGTKVMDLACGRGRHSITLNKLGFDVTGVDLSQSSICEAKESVVEGLKFDVHDMREVYPDKFEAIFNLFTSFGYFDSVETNELVIQSIYKMLVDGGLLVIDFMNATKVIANLVEEETKEVQGITFNITRRYDGHHIFKSINFVDDGKSHSYTERVQALQIEDFEKLLTQNKFEILRTFGNFDLGQFNREKSDRLILVAQKK